MVATEKVALVESLNSKRENLSIEKAEKSRLAVRDPSHFGRDDSKREGPRVAVPVFFLMRGEHPNGSREACDSQPIRRSDDNLVPRRC